MSKKVILRRKNEQIFPLTTADQVIYNLQTQETLKDIIVKGFNIQSFPEELPVASSEMLGCIKVGEGLIVDEYGVLNSSSAEQIEIGETKENQRDVVIEYWVSSDGKSWYRKWLSGWIEQGGVLSGTSGLYTVTLQIPYTNNLYTLVMGNADADTNTNLQNSIYYNKTNTSFQTLNAYGSSYYTQEISWYSCGY